MQGYTVPYCTSVNNINLRQRSLSIQPIIPRKFDCIAILKRRLMKYALDPTCSLLIFRVKDPIHITEFWQNENLAM
jgi:hypothetical protein